ncbi:MAG: hypothetical protein EPN23_06910 [Verrucomicrobia bacterium]|nr:MAG: hypothetical protein EPN23_06910 [Verrucomicrobiota bacterium]
MNWQTIKAHVWGPVGSVIFHIVLIIVLIKFAVQSGSHDVYTSQEVVMDTVETKRAPEVEKQVEEVIKQLDTQKELDTTVPPPDMPMSSDNNPTVQDTAAGAGGVRDMGFGKDGAAPGLDFASQVKSPLIIKGLAKGYGGRFGKGGMAGFVGSARAKEIDEAIMRALRWLKAHQLADGAWAASDKYGGGGGNAAMTGLAILCYLAYGQTTASSEFGPTVEKAINWLKSSQDQMGYFGAGKKITPETVPGSYPYTHGIATYALSEAYGMTRIPDLKPAVEKAVQIIIQGQQKETGGWDYSYAKGARRDTSVSAWQVQALKAALIAGCATPGIKEALDASVKDLKKVWNPQTGRFGYNTKAGGSLGVSGAGALCLQFTGHGKDMEVLACLRVLREAKINWEGAEGTHPLYGFYYITQCRFQESKESFALWQTQFVPTYLKAQKSDGHWEAMGGKNSEGNIGPVYSTTLACLTMETFVRFLPSYQHVEEGPAAPTNTDDVIIKVL